MSSPVEDVLIASDLTHQFGEQRVLDETSIRLSSGAQTAVVGPNGSGKTTLLGILAGILSPRSGRVTVAIDDAYPIGYLPQTPQFRGVLTVEETLDFYADLLGPAVDVESTIDRVGLTAVRNRRVRALSGGMLRLLGLAQALLGSPPVLLLDEPTSGLDPRMAAHISSVIESLPAEQSVLLATHDLEHAAQADTLVILHRGRVVARGSPEAIRGDVGASSLSEAFLELVGSEPTVQAGVGESP